MNAHLAAWVITMGRKRIVNFGLPAELAEITGYLLEEHPGLGFSSHADVIKYAVRRYYEFLLEQKTLPPNIFIPGEAKRQKPRHAAAERQSP